MPQTRAPLPYKVAFSSGGVEWRVEKLGRVLLDPRRNVRAALFIDGAFSRVATVTPNRDFPRSFAIFVIFRMVLVSTRKNTKNA